MLPASLHLCRKAQGVTPSATQGIRWVLNREMGAGLVVVQQSQPKYIDKVLHCIENGLPLLFENLPIDIDAVLDPVLGKSTVKRGRAVVMRLGDAEVEVDPRFRLYLQVTYLWGGVSVALFAGLQGLRVIRCQG